MQIVILADNLHELSKPVSWGKNKKIIVVLSCGELPLKVIKDLKKNPR